MSDKRYQVFISSTFSDLEQERQSAIRALLSVDCFPSGMEMFPASDESQWEMIQSFIDQSDYYFVISAGKYGSISPETGIAYTEMEYDYARERGIPVVAFLHSNIDSLSADKVELDNDRRDQLINFQEKLKSDKVVDFWDNADAIFSKVIGSVHRLKKTRTAEGWVKANSVASSEVLAEINQLRKENSQLLEKVARHEQGRIGFNPNYEWGEEEFRLRGRLNRSGGKIANWSITRTWPSWFRAIAHFLKNGESLTERELLKEFSAFTQRSMNNYSEDFFEVTPVDENDVIDLQTNVRVSAYTNAFEVIVCQMLVHNLFVRTSDGKISLTEFGRNELVSISARKVVSE